MEVIRIIGIGLVAAALSLLLKQQRPELAFALPILGAAAIFLVLAPYLQAILSMFTDIAGQVGIESRYLRMIIKMIGIAYLCQFSAELCKDAGEASIGGKIELAGKLLILSLSMPIIYKLLGLVSSIINF